MPGMSMIHVLHVEMPGRAPMVAGIFSDHWQACCTMLAIAVVLQPRAMWVAGQHAPAQKPPPACCYGASE